MKLLEQCGLVPTAVDNGAEALRVLDARPDDFDAVLTDIQLPVLDGLAARRNGFVRGPSMALRSPRRQ